MNRRKFLKKSFYTSVGIGVATGFYTWQIEPFWLEFIKLKMPIKNLPSHLVGKTLMQISDMHVGNRFDYNYLIESFKEAKAYKPDYVVYTGDFVSYEDKKQLEQLETVLKDAVKGSLGTIAILGNHDYGKDWAEQDVADSIVEKLENVDIKVLCNEHKEINGLNFIGFDDYWSINFKPEKAMQLYDSKKANIVLCHNPDVCDLDVWKGYKGWVLSGYARWKDGRKEGEVDLVLVDDKNYKPVWGVEIKWSNRYFDKPQELKSLIKFCEANNLSSAVVTSIDQIGVKEIKDLKLTYLPASIYAYNIGEITLKMKTNT